MDILAKNESDTARFAEGLAKEMNIGDVVALTGPLGAGKTVVARALIRALTQKSFLEVPSPTFTLVQTYEFPKGDIWHFDLYRLEDPGEIYELGWEEALHGGIVLIEWPERIKSLLPPSRLDIHIRSVENKTDQRVIQTHRLKG